MATIKKLLVANRGEIAIRIFRACKEMGIATVAIFSDIDREALHLGFADEAWHVGETAPATSYLNIGKILEIAKRSGAQAVHPGYGFLAENPRFASAVVSADLIWVGPPPEAVAYLGDKTAARKIAAAAGVGSVPGTADPIPGPEVIAAFTSEHGWPVALKAAHGGGGRGFRVVRQDDDAQAAFEAAAREAQLAFGNPEVYLERYLDGPRHIEVQVMGDSHGNLIHLGERDCSLQRRHQKLIEESPSPAVDADLRQRLGEAAVAVSRQAGYHSAGTVEFLVQDRRFWFLEMNTRLQVEHPVTETVAGIDLVKEMIQVAEGARLSLTQDEVVLRGHAIECRINAEDPAQEFMPSPGTVDSYSAPSGPGVRIDSGIAAGSVIPQAYDSLVAKLICSGADRVEALARARRSLGELHIAGVQTTIPFHRFVLGTPWFAAGDFSTKTVEANIGDWDFAAPVEHAPPGPRPAASSVEQLISVELNGKRFEVRVRRPGGRQKPAPPNRGEGALAGADGEVISAPMQGTIIKTLRQEGDHLKPGDPILVLEAMKMENSLKCSHSGVLKELRVKAGDTVNSGAVLAVVGPA